MIIGFTQSSYPAYQPSDEDYKTYAVILDCVNIGTNNEMSRKTNSRQERVI